MEGAPDEIVGGALDEAARAPETPGRLSSQGPRGARSPALLLVGASPAMHELRERIERAAHRDMPVLITGETGTGKTLVARAIHQGSARRAGAFLSINVGAVSEGLVDSELFGHREGAFTGAHESRRGAFRSASGGTLLLDEIGDLPPTCQVKLLTVLEDRLVRPVGEDLPVAVDVRLVFATHRDLARLVADGGFRQDLAERIRHYEIHVPALRERAGDIPLLVRHFLAERGGEVTVSAAALERLITYAWPGNVRELQHVLEAALVDAGPHGVILPGHLGRLERETARRVTCAPTAQLSPSPASGPASGTTAPALAPARGDATLDHLIDELLAQGLPVLEGVTRRAVALVLGRCRGNTSEAARLLGIHRNTLMRQYPDARRRRAP